MASESITTPLFGWLLVSLAWIAYAFWVRYFYHENVSDWVPAAIVLAGITLFVGVNRWWYFGKPGQGFVEWLVIALGFGALYATHHSVLWALENDKELSELL